MIVRYKMLGRLRKILIICKDEDDNMQYEQLKLFTFEESLKNDKADECSQKNAHSTNVSEKIAGEFAIQSLPFLGCDFDKIYPIIKEVLPKESITFEEFGMEQAIMCEIICAAICHQINWDYLRKQIYKKTKSTPEWLFFDNLETMTEDEVYEMLCTYDKIERIRAKERSDIIIGIGNWAKRFNEIKGVFFKREGILLDYEVIRNNILLCPAFSGDPQEKKLQLLIQKLSAFENMAELSLHYRPAIDYHLIRNYLRRGLIYSKTKHAREYIENNLVERTEKTVGAIRMHCASMMEEISIYTGLDINIINLIEWHIGRSVCTQENADCKLETKDSQWLKPVFETCPFYDTCLARCYNQDYLEIQEPNYKGSSY